MEFGAANTMSKKCARCEKNVYPVEELRCLDKVRGSGVVGGLFITLLGCCPESMSSVPKRQSLSLRYSRVKSRISAFLQALRSENAGCISSARSEPPSPLWACPQGRAPQ